VEARSGKLPPVSSFFGKKNCQRELSLASSAWVLKASLEVSSFH